MKANMTRRSAASLLAGLPMLGRQAGVGALNGGMVHTAESGPPNVPQAPKMPEWQAMRFAMADPDMRRLIVSQLYERHRAIMQVDPDIEIFRSFSPMAKITFQRMRNVEREIASNTEPPSWEVFDAARQYIKRLMWG